MGQHKHNPTAIKAKNGEIKSKEKGLSKAQSKRFIEATVKTAVESICPFPFVTKYMG